MMQGESIGQHAMEFANSSSEFGSDHSESSPEITIDRTPLLSPSKSSTRDFTTNHVESITAPLPSQSTDSQTTDGNVVSDRSKPQNQPSLNNSIREFLVAYGKLEEHKSVGRESPERYLSLNHLIPLPTPRPCLFFRPLTTVQGTRCGPTLAMRQIWMRKRLWLSPGSKEWNSAKGQQWRSSLCIDMNLSGQRGAKRCSDIVDMIERVAVWAF
jgi:hypothetical protein